MKKGFRSKVHLICSTDALRHHMNHVYFNNGFLYATDGHAAIKQHLSLHDFTEDEIKLMNDKFIHRTVFPDLLKAEVVKTHEKGLVAVSKTGAETLFVWAIVTDKFPSVDTILRNEKTATPLPEWGIDPNLLKMVYDAMPIPFRDGVKLTFTGARHMILVEPIAGDSLQMAIIMPMAINDEWRADSRGINHPLVK